MIFRVLLMLRENVFGSRSLGKKIASEVKPGQKTPVSRSELRFYIQSGDLLWGPFHWQFSVEMLPERFKISRTFQGIMVPGVLM